jgi:hypothetical protein
MTTNDPQDRRGFSARFWAGWATVLASMALLTSVWNATGNLGHISTGGAAVIISWPTYIHPPWMGITLALITLGIIGQTYDRLVKRDRAKAEQAKVWVCTECDSAGWPGSAHTAEDHRSGTGHLTRSGGPEVLAAYHPDGLAIGPDDSPAPGQLPSKDGH